jgi:hypothetical protein
VSDLIDPYTSWWDKELVKEIFWEEDVKHILAIPIKQGVVNMAPYAISSSLILVIHDNMNNGTNHIV